MSFNATTYRANKYARSAYAHIAQAKDIKARAARGEAYDWELDRIPSLVTIARLDMKISRGEREIAKLTKGRR